MATDWNRLQNLFEEYRNGNEECTQPLFSALEDILLGFFRARMGNSSDYEDLTQVTLLKIHFARERFNQNQALKTWVFTIANRCLIDHWRGYKSTEPIDTATEEVSYDIDIKAELTRDLNKALNTLKPIDRSIVYLYVVEEMTMQEIAKALGLTENAVKIRAHRSYAKMKEILLTFIFAVLLAGNLYESF